MAGVLTAVRPRTLRRLSQPRTSATPVVSVMRATAIRAEPVIRVVTSTSVIAPVRSPEMTTVRDGTRRDLICAAVSVSFQREKRFPTRAQSSKIVGCDTVQKSAIPGSLMKSGGVPSPS